MSVLLISGFFDRSGRLSSFHFNVPWRIVPAGALVTLALVVLAAVALGFSTRVGTAPTVTLSLGVFILGLMSDYWFGPDGSGSFVALICRRLIPNWQHFWMSDALADGGAIPAAYALRAGLYGLAYLAGILLLGMVSFRHAEVK